MSRCSFPQLLEQCCDHLVRVPLQVPATPPKILLLLLLLLLRLLLLLLVPSTFENNMWSKPRCRGSLVSSQFTSL